MEEKLLSLSVNDYLNARKMYMSLYILLLVMCGAAYSQPTMIAQIPNASKNFVYVNGNLYYSFADSLFRANSSSTPVLVKEVGQPILQIYNITVGTNFFFVTQNGTAQTLWRTDGTSANTVQVFTEKRIIPLLAYHSQLFLMINSANTGNELWKMDGAYSVTLLKDANPGPLNGYVNSLIINNDRLYFFGNNGSGVGLWSSDGTTAGTALSVSLPNYDSYTPDYYGLTSVNGTMFFTIYHEAGDYGNITAELWKSDGTTGGTAIIFESTGGFYYNYLSDLIASNGKLYFFHSEGDPAYTYFSVSDGTTAGTKHLQLVSIDGDGRRLTRAGAYVLFYGTSQGYTTPIKKSDGTTISTVHEFSQYHTGDYYVNLTYADGRAFFIDEVDAYDWPDADSQLWQADLAAGTTQTVMDIHHVSLNASRSITATTGSAIFLTRLVSGKLTLWYYDPEAPVVPSPCESAGFIEREKWNNISGYGVSTIPVNTQPSSVSALNSFASPQNDGDSYGARMRGYICAPEDGNYVFYISSDDNSELWLSTDDTPANKRLIASSKWTNYNEWTKYPTQQSVEIALVKGNKYYIEALHKEAAGADHLSVGWKLPNGTLERPIAGMRLSPYERNNPPTVVILHPDDDDTFTTPATIDIEAFPRDDESIAKVAFYSSGTFLGEALTYPYKYQWKNVPAGNYTIEARAIDNEGFVGSDFQTVTVAPPCSGTGSIFQEFWVNVGGADVRTFDFSVPPNGGGREFPNFETTQYYSNNYASRMRGYVCVPQSGNYTFWISSDDYSELYLSSDESVANMEMIAWVYGATPFRNYDKYSSQKSAQVFLQAGHKYYIEARHKEATGNDFISVGWQLPSGVMERPIPGNRLIPIYAAPNEPPSITITSPQPNQNFTSPASVRIAADVTDPNGVSYVQFDVVYGSTSSTLARFTSPPYEYTWNNVPSGSYQLLVSASDTRNTGTGKSIFFSVDKSACTGTGTITREIWTGIPGTSVSSIPVNSPPNATVNLTSFATSNYYGNDYGSRIRGYVCAPVSGVYTFLISSDDNSELWLSDNDDPATKRLIAYVNGATAVNQWNKYSTQISGGKNLVQGQRYYIEVLHKEGGGADHVEVGWDLPQGPQERPIPGSRLIPFEDPSTSTTVFSKGLEFIPEDNNTVSIYPNPVVSGKQLTLFLPGDVTGDLAVDIASVTGVSVQNEKLFNTSNEVVIDLKPSISPGIYLITVSDNKRRWLNKVQIK
jgi:ELWxxDGT repeat protein